ncbi:tannase/feruloyl esterase family alpha/beta hydrolase [Sulfitobacter geojensis]|uniref:tannase/feruloyl esterase family alpha/beta hydrolase n=1 Tax=Sulfitobacter geojensis TaxID=1342299 RepID=UPI0036DDB972
MPIIRSTTALAAIASGFFLTGVDHADAAVAGDFPNQFLSCFDAANLTEIELPADVQGFRLIEIAEHAGDKGMPAHCEIVGAINDRISPVDGQHYSIKFRLRLPQDWNGRFYMEGGGGSNGALKDAMGPTGLNQEDSALERGFAVVTTDSGHDNDTNSDSNASGRSAFGMDPQARLDFGYMSYDIVTRVGKAIVEKYYGAAPEKSYFIGCSEGGREAALMTQRYPDLYDGIAAGAPGIHFSYSAAYAPFLLRIFGNLAETRNQSGPDGIPLLNKLYSDNDVQLIADAVVGACDALDGLEDRMSNNIEACTTVTVLPRLRALTCSGAKEEGCLLEDQINAFVAGMAGPVTSDGTRLYPGHPWDPGIGGRIGDSVNDGFRSWWFGSYDSDQNNARKVTLSTPQHAMLWQTPPVPLRPDEYVRFEMNFNIDETPALAYATTDLYPVSSAELGNADSPDLSDFASRGGKLVIYHGAADAAFSALDTIKYWNAVNETADGQAADFARLFIIPGMNHCQGGPATDDVDLLTPLMAWVEDDLPIERLEATVSNPDYFGGKNLSRPLCPYPLYAEYDGEGDPSSAESFTCVAN